MIYPMVKSLDFPLGNPILLKGERKASRPASDGRVVDSVEVLEEDETSKPTNTSLRQIHGFGARGKLPVEYADLAASDLPYGYVY